MQTCQILQHFSTGIQASKDTSPVAAVLPVRMPGGKGIALESSFQHGLKQERLRTLCQVVNSTSLTLEISIVDTPQDQQQESARPSQGSRKSIRPKTVSIQPSNCILCWTVTCECMAFCTGDSCATHALASIERLHLLAWLSVHSICLILNHAVHGAVPFSSDW